MAALAVDDLVRVEVVTECAFYTGDIFRRAFGGEPPDFPFHLVAMYKAARNAFVAAGYLHCSVFDDLCLCGGLVEDERAIRRMPAAHQAALRSSGGIAQRLLDAAAGHFAHMPALWAMVGDPPVRAIFHAAQFESAPAPSPYLMVHWNVDTGTAARDDLLRRVIAFGPF